MDQAYNRKSTTAARANWQCGFEFLACVKSSQGLLFSEAKKPYAEAVGQTGAQGLVRGCGPHCPPVSRKNPARDEASGAPRAGRGSASFSGLISGVRVLSPALSGGRPGFRGG